MADNFFKGQAYGYNGLLTYTHENAKARFKEILASYGIKTVYYNKVINENGVMPTELFFENLTLVIKPINIMGVDKDTDVEEATFVFKGQKFLTSNYLKQLDDGVERIKHGDHVIADYYKARNLIIMYFNPFPEPPRIRKFQNAMGLLFSNISGLEIVDNSERMKDVIKKKSYAVFSKNLKQKYSKLKEEIVKSEETTTKLCKDLVRVEKNIEVSNKTCEVISKMMENFDTEFEKIVEEVEALPFIKSLKLKHDGIHLDYGEVTIDYKGTNYYIGHMTVHLKYDTVVFDNLNNPCQKHPHPHVYSGGSACLGSFSGEVSKLLASLQLRKLAILLKQMLFSYNDKSPVLNIEHWKDKILPENVKKQAAANTQSTVGLILNSPEYKSGQGLTTDQYRLLNPAHRKQYIMNRRSRR